MGAASAAAAEPVDKNTYDFGFIESTSPWLTSSNGAGLRWLRVPSVSQAGAYFTKQFGDFRNYYESDNSYQFGISTESYLTIKKISLYGCLGYDNFMGRNMTGSIWVDPYDAPFDMVEYTDANAGEKNREDYKVAAGVGYDLAKNLRIGARADYTATNYAKRKDLRHANTKLDMELSLGLTYTFADYCTVGANYLYARNIEELEFEIDGVKDKQYDMLITPGGFIGKRETFSEINGGYTHASAPQPLFNRYQGAAVQLGFDNGRVEMFYEFVYKSREGYYGLKHNTYYPYYTEHEADIFRHTIYGAYKTAAALHTAKLVLEYDKLENYELAYETGRDEGGVYYVNYFGRNLNADRETIDISGQYRSAWDLHGYMPRWSVSLDGRYRQRNLTASVFPFYRNSKIRYAALSATLQRAFFVGKNVVDLKVKGGYARGGGFKAFDNVYTEPSPATAKPAEVSAYLDREFEYFRAPRFEGAFGARYTRMFAKGVNAYIDLKYDFTAASDIVYLDGSKHHIFRITLGCTF